MKEELLKGCYDLCVLIKARYNQKHNIVLDEQFNHISITSINTKHDLLNFEDYVKIAEAYHLCSFVAWNPIKEKVEYIIF